MNPFAHITGPACVNFSGGRTSGYMLWRTLQAHDGKLPPDVHTIFCNTGKERPETLDFVQRCSEEWNVPVTWLEYKNDAPYEIVNHNSAARRGEPFKAMVRKERYLPNPVAAICTKNLKIKPVLAFMGHYGSWTSYVGLRADEPARVMKRLAQNDDWNKGEFVECPLYRSGTSKWDIADFWSAQPFDLALKIVKGSTPESNCDLCYKKSRQTIQTLMAKDPSLADDWIEMEEETPTSNPKNSFFRYDRPSYREMRDLALSQGHFDFGDESSIDCFCTD